MRKIFPFDLAFSMTVHKAQGRTLRKVILALSKRPIRNLQLRYQTIFVAMSRVRHSDNIRLLLAGTGGHDELNYICALSPPDEFRFFFKGFEGQNLDKPQKWDMEKVFRAKQQVPFEFVQHSM